MKPLHRLTYFLPIISLLFLNDTLQAQFNLSERLPIDARVKVGKLANGLTYYIRKNTKPEKKVQLRLIVNAGSVLEDPEQVGLAHMMEHMNFNGSIHFPKNELVSYLQSIGVEFGADLNAYTDFDETVYILPIPSDNHAKIDSGFTILEDWAGKALLDSVEIDKERGVVLEESRLGKGAGERMRNKYFPRLMNGSRYANRLPIGKDDTIRHFKYSTLRRFYHDWYRPDLEAIVVVGDIDPDSAEAEIVRHFSQLRNPKNERARPSIIPLTGRTEDVSMVVTDKEETNTLLQVYDFLEKEKPIVSWADYRMTIIEGLFSSLLNQRLDELTQLASPPFIYGRAGFSSFVRGYRSFNSFIVLGNKPADTAINALVNVLNSVKKFGFLESELDRAKSNLENQANRAFKDRDKTESENYVQGYVNNFLSGDPIIGIDNRLKFIHEVLPTISLADVNAVTNKLESKQGKFALLMAPSKDQQFLPTDKKLLEIFRLAQRIPARPYAEKTLSSSLMKVQPLPGAIRGESANDTLGTINLDLSNDITVTLKPTNYKNDEIKMDSWRRGGSLGYGLEKKLAAESAASIVEQMGIADLSSVDLRKFLAGKSVSVTPYINPDDEGIEGTSSVKDLETFFQMIYLYFTQPRRDEKIFSSYVATQKATLKNLADNPEAYFADTLSKFEFGNNPWAEAFPKANEFDKINVDEILSIYKNIYSNAFGWHFTFVGNLDTAKMKSLIRTYIASLPTSPKKNVSTDVGLRPRAGMLDLTVRKGTAKKCLVNIIFNGEAAYSNESAMDLQILVDLLNIKILEKLREDMSGIYGGGLRGSLVNRPYNNYSVSLSFPCGPENVDKLVSAALDIIRTAQEKGIEQKDLEKVKETLKKQNQDAMMENDHWLDELSTAWIEQTDPSWILKFASKVGDMQIGEVQEAAKKYLHLYSCIKAVLYPEK
ncbi:MAG TPA: insulinase family protein [Puia sp.]|nr:insulinase family protein [Puia sp.]